MNFDAEEEEAEGEEDCFQWTVWGGEEYETERLLL